jgi:creatinine amidohydrolase/Fe(II)-dependent formamide hydrolase-like protein
MEFTHAGSMETAAVLAYDAALVHLENAAGPSERQAAETAHGLFRRPDVYPVLRDFRQIAATGWYGRPERATPARAEQIAEAVADHVVARAREIWEALGTGGGAAEGSGPSGERGFPPAGTAFPEPGGPE